MPASKRKQKNKSPHTKTLKKSSLNTRYLQSCLHQELLLCKEENTQIWLVHAGGWHFLSMSLHRNAKNTNTRRKNTQSMPRHLKLWMFVPVSKWFFCLVFVGVFRGIFCFVLLFLLGFFPGLTFFGIGNASVFSTNLKWRGVCMGGLTKALT